MSQLRPRSPRAVVFDLDGTLVNSMPMVLKAYTHALSPFHPTLTEADLLRQLGGPPERMFRDMFGDHRAEEAMNRLIDYNRQHWHLIQAFDGAHGLLDHLRGASREVAIWTGRERGSTETILREQRIGALHTVICGDDLDTHKPHPAGLRTIMDRVGTTAVETLYVGDADVDVLAAAVLQVPVVLIRHDRIVDPAIEAQAWRVVDTPTQAYAAIVSALG